MPGLEWNTDQLSTSQKKIADFITKNVHNLAYLTEQEIADELNISVATVSRFWRAVGYKNAKEFKRELKDRMEVTPATKMKSILEKVDDQTLSDRLLEQGRQYLSDTKKRLDKENFEQALTILNQAQTIYVYAPGPSEGLGKLFDFRLSRFGFSVKLLPKSGHELYETLIHIEKQDVVFVIGFVRMLPETEVLFQQAEQAGYKTVLLTDRLVSDMIDRADVALYTSRGELWEFHSMVAPVALMEALIVGLGKREEDRTMKKLSELNRLRKRYSAKVPK